MRLFKSPSAFARTICKETGHSRPYWKGYAGKYDGEHWWASKTAPRSYSEKLQVRFYVNDRHHVERKYGVWVEGQLTDTQAQLLKQRYIILVLGRLVDILPKYIDKDARTEIERYLERDLQQCRQMASGDPLPAVIE